MFVRSIIAIAYHTCHSWEPRHWGPSLSKPTKDVPNLTARNCNKRRAFSRPNNRKNVFCSDLILFTPKLSRNIQKSPKLRQLGHEIVVPGHTKHLLPPPVYLDLHLAKPGVRIFRDCRHNEPSPQKNMYRR